jgi:hypothetical protein
MKCPRRDALDSLLPFTEPEKEFLDRLLDCAEIKPALLIEDEGLATRIRHHPGFEWKAINVRKFICKGGKPMTPEIEAVFAEEDMVTYPRVLVREYDFAMIGKTVRVRIYNHLAEASHGRDSMGFELSHHINTPVQVGVYVPGTRFYGTEASALRSALRCLTRYYKEAVEKQHQPSEEWLEENRYFK